MLARSIHKFNIRGRCFVQNNNNNNNDSNKGKNKLMNTFMPPSWLIFFHIYALAQQEQLKWSPLQGEEVSVWRTTMMMMDGWRTDRQSHRQAEELIHT